jgi:hypothetical protein
VFTGGEDDGGGESGVKDVPVPLLPLPPAPPPLLGLPPPPLVPPLVPPTFPPPWPSDPIQRFDASQIVLRPSTSPDRSILSDQSPSESPPLFEIETADDAPRRPSAIRFRTLPFAVHTS